VFVVVFASLDFVPTQTSLLFAQVFACAKLICSSAIFLAFAQAVLL
jgi:hypothetical protein